MKRLKMMLMRLLLLSEDEGYSEDDLYEDWKPEKTMDQVTGGNESCKRKNKRMVVLQNKISKQSVAALPKVNFEEESLLSIRRLRRVRQSAI